MSFGVGQTMYRSIKANLQLKGKRITYFERTVQKAEKNPILSLSTKRFSKEELIAFKAKLKKEKKVLFVKRLIVTLFIFIALNILIKMLITK